ncbi:MAG: transposase [Methylococcales bacterium]|nr:transposase [Methylococcales bacterium]
MADKIIELNIELLYLPTYSPNLNLIERLEPIIKKRILFNRYYGNFSTLKNSIDTCLSGLSTHFKKEIRSLMTLSFKLF